MLEVNYSVNQRSGLNKSTVLEDLITMVLIVDCFPKFVYLKIYMLLFTLFYTCTLFIQEKKNSVMFDRDNYYSSLKEFKIFYW